MENVTHTLANMNINSDSTDKLAKYTKQSDPGITGFLGLPSEIWARIIETMLYESPQELNNARLSCKFIKTVIDNTPGRKFQQVITFSSCLLDREDILNLRRVSRVVKRGVDRLMDLYPCSFKHSASVFHVATILRPFPVTAALFEYCISIGFNPRIRNPFPGRILALQNEPDTVDYLLFVNCIPVLHRWGDQLWGIGLHIYQYLDLATIHRILTLLPNLRRFCLTSADDNDMPIAMVRMQLDSLGFPNLPYLKSLDFRYGTPWLGEFGSRMIQHYASQLKHIHLEIQTRTLDAILPDFVLGNEAMENLQLPKLRSMDLVGTDEDLTLSILKYWTAPQLEHLDLYFYRRNMDCWNVKWIFNQISLKFGDTLKSMSISNPSKCGVQVGRKELDLPHIVALSLGGFKIKKNAITLLPYMRTFSASWVEGVLLNDEVACNMEFLQELWKVASPNLRAVFGNGEMVPKPEMKLSADQFVTACKIFGLLPSK